ncbi:MAG: DMT family transporter [Acidobacteriota bacterium]|nr:DMT family transporter [Acidobacteriota bacterium]
MTTPSEQRTGLGALAICLAAALWGFDGVVLTPRLFALPVLFVVFLLHAVPFLLMQGFLRDAYRALAALPVTGWVNLILVAAVGGLLGTLAIVTALFLVEFNQLSVVVLLQKLQPLFAILLAAVLLRERPTKRFLLWAALAILGAYWLTFGWRLPEFSGGSTTARAAVFALLAAASFGSATVLGKRLLGSLDFWQATFGRYGVTSLLTVILLVATGVGFPFASVTPSQWIVILIIGVTTGSGAIFLYYWGLQRIRAMTATICELCLPLAAVVFDYLVNGSRLTPAQILGGLLLLGAITRVSTQQGPDES